MTQQLSPATKAVLDAALPVYDDEHLYVASVEKHAGMIAAAALRAAADQVVPTEHELVDGYLQYEKQNSIREAFLAIATELEAQ